MNKIDYLKYAITNRVYAKLEWFFTLFGIVDYSRTKPEYLKLENGKIKALVNQEWVELDHKDINTPVFGVEDKITIDNTWINNVSEITETTVGRLLANKILLEDNFKDKIPYINKAVTVKKMEQQIGNLMRAGTISVDEYIKFASAVSFITNFSKIVTVSATEKAITPPPGIEKFKKELTKKYDEKFGKDWKTKRAIVQQWQDEILQLDKDYIKDDPSYGILMSGKITSNARVKMFLTFGGEAGFDKTSGKVTTVENSLEKGYPKEAKQLSAVFNSSRVGSFDRGHETQKGGAAAKDILRATSAIKISKGDCGSKKGYTLEVNKANAGFLTGRYMLDGKKIENGEDLIGKEIVIRSTMYCQTPGSTYCSICSGDVAAATPTGVSLRLLDVSNTLLSLSLKGMHNSQVQIYDYNIKSALT